jgi:hypothetical protein
MYLTVVFYLPKDGLIVGRNMYEVTVHKLIPVNLCALVGTTIVYIATMGGLWIT